VSLSAVVIAVFEHWFLYNSHFVSPKCISFFSKTNLIIYLTLSVSGSLVVIITEVTNIV